MIQSYLVMLACLGAACAAAAAPEVRVTGGTVRGLDMPDGSTLFLSIPYAAPPVGDLRWKPAQPVVPWQGTRDATQPPSPCLQHDEGWNAADVAISKEDCLYLSIRSPQHTAQERLPVIFWIHGGSNRAGDGYGYPRDTTITQHGVVLVALEYRLGVFGFLGSPELTAESPQHASGNYALTDMIAALEWVKANIAEFGGDPANVTIAGQSAGGGDVLSLTLSPLARGLFKKAITESAALGPSRTAAENDKIGNDLLELMHLPSGKAGLEALRAAPAAAVLAAGEKLQPPRGVNPSLLWLQQIVDGWVEPLPARAVYARHEQAPVAMIIGDNTREFPGTPPDQERAMLRDQYGAQAGELLKLYGLGESGPVKDDPVLGDPGTQFVTDLLFRCPARQLAREMLQAGQKVWRYQFGLPRPGTAGPVEHSAELDYVFKAAPAGATFETWPPVQEYWANFARTGDPNGPGLPGWPEMGTTLNYIAFLPTGPVVRQDLRGKVCKILEMQASG
jgi:para-nitrobenzyl esterase